MHDDLNSVVQKLRGFLSPRHNGGLDKIASVFHAHARSFVGYENHGEHIDDLANAIAQRRYCEIEYYSAWNKTTKDHRIKPLKLLWHNSALYLLALIEGKQEITTFSVQRIRQLTSQDESFPAPKVDVQAHTRRAFGVWVSDDIEDVEILFSEEMAWRVEERTYHPDETKKRLPDGRLSYTLRTSAQWEIIPWILSFGAHAELITPASWRETMRETAVAVGKMYSE